MNRNNSLDRRTFVTGTFATGALVAAGAAACGCSAPTSTDGSQGAASLSHPPDDTQKNASAMTADANEAVYALLDFSDERERDFASRNLIAAP